MISTLITRGTRNSREKTAQDVCEKLAIHQYDIQTFAPSDEEDKESNDEKFGIAFIRRIKQKAMLKPTYSSQNALLIHEAQLLTVAAQQALLKLLEEPPEHTSIILTAETEDALLPTICSRCRIIHVQGETMKQPSESFLLSEMTAGEQLQLAEKILKSGSAEWMKHCIHAHREHLLVMIKNKKEQDTTYEYKNLVTLLQNAQEAHTLLTTTNTNPRLIVEHFLFSNRSN